MNIVKSTATSLKATGRDEKWLQEWFAEDPTRLGLGNVAIKKKELRHYTGKGGRLDILAYNAALDTYYEIEVMLGECDADHGFRVLDYWARERLRLPNARHVAVLIAEDLSGRYKSVIETLTQHLPLIAIEIKTLAVSVDPPVATIVPIVFAQPDDIILRPPDEPEDPTDGVALNDEGTWHASRPEFTEAAKLTYKLCNEKIGPTTIDFSAKSYISLRKGRRVWLPMWPLRDGFRVYVPAGPGGAEDRPNDFFAVVQESLADLSIEPSWSFKYNGGANPISFSIQKQYLSHSKILDILQTAYGFA